MSTLSLRIPESLHKSIRELSESEGISINQFLTSAEASKSNREDFLSVLAKVPDIEPEPHDAI